jgi:predicted transcriptional regulator
MPRNPQTSTAFTVSLPVAMARQIERARKAEHRTRSELTREAFRVYFQRQDALAELDALITEGAHSPTERVTAEWWEQRHAALARHQRQRARKQPQRKRA